LEEAGEVGGLQLTPASFAGLVAVTALAPSVPRPHRGRPAGRSGLARRRGLRHGRGPGPVLRIRPREAYDALSSAA